MSQMITLLWVEAWMAELLLIKLNLFLFSGGFVRLPPSSLRLVGATSWNSFLKSAFHFQRVVWGPCVCVLLTIAGITKWINPSGCSLSLDPSTPNVLLSVVALATGRTGNRFSVTGQRQDLTDDVYRSKSGLLSLTSAVSGGLGRNNVSPANLGVNLGGCS